MKGIPRGAVEKPKNIKLSAKKLLNLLPIGKMLFVVCLEIIAQIFSIIGPKLMGEATTEIWRGTIVSAQPSIDFQVIARILLTLIMLYIVSAAFSYFKGYTMAGITTKVAYNLRNSIMQKLNRLPLSYFDSKSHGDVLSRFTNDVDTVSQTLNEGVMNFITATVSVMGVLIVMLTISWQMTLAAVTMIPVSMGLVMLLAKNSQKFFRGQQTFLGSVNGHIEEIYSGHLVMKAFSGEKVSLERFDEINTKLCTATFKAQFISGLMRPVMLLVSNLGYVIICILGASMVSTGALNIGNIQSFIQYTRTFTQPIAQIASIANVLQQMIAAAERVFEFLEEEEECKDTPKIEHHKIYGRVCFENVSFSYSEGNSIIKNFSATIEPGQKVAIVGPTGAGKTTIVKLLMRFYDVNSGKISIDDIDIREFSRDDLRNMFGMVLQDTWLYNDTIMENIRYGKPNASDEEVIMAAKGAQAHHFIRTLPGAYAMEINEDADNISAGQKQLITIARALLKSPQLLILDEATSSVDTRTEVSIQQAMTELMKGRTSFIIAHRLSTIKNADMILFMDKGDIVEQGNHSQLLALGGAYAELYQSQFE